MRSVQAAPQIWDYSARTENGLHATCLLQPFESSYWESWGCHGSGKKSVPYWISDEWCRPRHGGGWHSHTLCTGTNLTQQVCFTEEERILQNGKLYAQNHLAGEWRNSRLPIRFLKALTPVTWCCSQAQQQKPARKLIALCLVQNFCSPYFILIPWTGLICVM